MNATLVVKQVDELFSLASKLLNLNSSKKFSETKYDHQEFNSIFNQVRFYVEQQFLRGYAGWLIDENNIHSPEYARLKLHKKQVYGIAKNANILTTSAAQPSTDIQTQCQHDSHAIAFLILQLSIKLKEDPEMKLDSEIPSHAKSILRNHARADGDRRYYEDKIWKPIQTLHTQCKQFLNCSTLTKSTEKLSKEAATIQVKSHKVLLKYLIDKFRDIQPNSKLFTTPYNWMNYDAHQNKSAYSCTRLRLFSGITIMSAIAVVSLLYQFTKAQSNNSSAPGS